MKISTLEKLRFGGAADAWSLTALGAAFVSTTPIIYQSTNPQIFFAGAFVGAALLAERLHNAFSQPNLLNSEVDISSSDPMIPPAEARKRTDVILVGYTTDNAIPIFLSYEDMTRHGLVLGASGSGKTVLGSTIMRQHIANGGGLTFVDGKMSREDLDAIYQMAAECGRAHDVLVINPGDPDCSNSYNPILYGDPDEVGSRILSLVPDASTSPGADFYRQSALQAITTLVRGIMACGKAFHFLDLSILLSNPKAMLELQRLVNQKANSISSSDTDTKASIDDIRLFLNRFTVKTKQGTTIDVKKMKELLGGIAGRLHSFGTGSFGRVMNTYNPEVNLFRDICANKIIYVMLPTMGKFEQANNFAKMFLGDYRTAISWIQALPPEKRPNPPHFNFLDEAGSYINNAFPIIMSQGRSARQILFPAAQVPANFDTISPEMGQMITGNTYFKFYFKLGTFEAAEAAANYIGMTRGITRTVADSDSTSDSTPSAAITPESSASAGQGLSLSSREEEQYLVHPDKLLSLAKGQCILHSGDGSVYDLKVPMFVLNPDLQKQIGPAKINRRPMPLVEGLNYADKISNFIDELRDLPEEPEGD